MSIVNYKTNSIDTGGVIFNLANDYEQEEEELHDTV